MSFLLSPRFLVAFTDVVTIYLYHYMHQTFYRLRPKAKQHPLLIFLVYVIDALIYIGVNYLEIAPLNLLAVTATYFIPIFIFYEWRNLRGTLLFLFNLFLTITLELILASLDGVLEHLNSMGTYYENIDVPFTLIMTLGQVLITGLICRYGIKDKDNRYSKATRLFLLLPLISLAGIIYEEFSFVFTDIASSSSVTVFQFCLLLVVINVLALILLERFTATMQHEITLTEEKAELEANAQLVERAAASMRDRLTAAERSIQRDRVMRHDRRHFEAMLYGLLQNGKAEEAMSYLKERLDAEPAKISYYCDNVTVNAAISYYVNRAKAEDIPFEVSADIPAELSVDDMELAVVLSNLMENALHACEAMPDGERHILLKAKCKKQLLLELENTCSGTPALDEDGYPVTDRKGHGIGTKSVLAFTEKTGSFISYQAEEGRFLVRLIVDN